MAALTSPASTAAASASAPTVGSLSLSVAGALPAVTAEEKAKARLRRAATSLTAEQQRRFEFVRWLQVAGCIGGSILIGAVFSFSLLIKPMRDHFHMTSSQATWISMCSWIFSLFTYPPGLALDRFGPRIVNGLTFALLVVGFFFLGLWFKLVDTSGVAAGTDPAPLWRVATVGATYTALSWAVSFMDPGLLFPCMTAFPLAKHDVIIIAKPFMGLGGSIFATWYIGFFDAKDGPSDMAHFYWFIAAVAVACGVLAVWVIPHHLHQTGVEDFEELEPTPSAEPIDDHTGTAAADAAGAALPPPSESTEVMYEYWRRYVPGRPIVYVGFAVLALNVVFMSTVTGVQSISRAVAENNDKPDPIPRGLKITFALGVAACIVLFGALPAMARSGRWRSTLHAATGSSALSTPTADGADGDALATPPGTTSAAAEDEDVRPPRCDSLLASLQTPMFWLLFVTLGMFWTLSATLVSYGTLMYAATLDSCADYDSAINATFAIVVSVCSSLGRVLCGLLERLFPRMPPTAYLFVSPLLLGLAHAVVTAVSYGHWASGTLALAFALQGVGEGMGWAGAALVVSNLYGPTTVGAHYGAFTVSGMVLIPVFLQAVAAPLERNALASMPAALKSWCCVGAECFGRTSAISLGLAAIGVTSGIALHLVWLYKRNQYRDECRLAAAKEASDE